METSQAIDQTKILELSEISRTNHAQANEVTEPRTRNTGKANLESRNAGVKEISIDPVHERMAINRQM